MDSEACQGHARCAAIAPAVFFLDEYGHAVVENAEVAVGMEDLVHTAFRTCPERAIRVV
ncbi:MAG: ferredoxin [Actinomycetota bacterium]|nr:ferredoxin [Actinomycetota bacterium]